MVVVVVVVVVEVVVLVVVVVVLVVVVVIAPKLYLSTLTIHNSTYSIKKCTRRNNG